MVIGFRVTSGDLGTHAMHPSGKRITKCVNTKVAYTKHLQIHQPSTYRNATGGHSGPPLNEDSINLQIMNRQTSQRAAWWSVERVGR